MAHNDGDSDNDDNSDDKDSDEPDNNPMEEVEPDDEVGDELDNHPMEEGGELLNDAADERCSGPESCSQEEVLNIARIVADFVENVGAMSHDVVDNELGDVETQAPDGEVDADVVEKLGEGDGVDAETQAPGDEVKADIVEKSGEGDGVDVETQAPGDEVEAENVAEKSEVDIAKKVVEEADVAMATEKSGVDVTIAVADFVIEGDKVVGDVAGKIRNKDEGLIGSNVGISSPKVYISKKRARSKNV